MQIRNDSVRLFLISESELMSTMYLHIGAPKTATTYLQNFFAINKKQLLDLNLLVPDFLGRFNLG
jgi:hypothetical protein